MQQRNPKLVICAHIVAIKCPYIWQVVVVYHITDTTGYLCIIIQLFHSVSDQMIMNHLTSQALHIIVQFIHFVSLHPSLLSAGECG